MNGYLPSGDGNSYAIIRQKTLRVGESYPADGITRVVCYPTRKAWHRGRRETHGIS